MAPSARPRPLTVRAAEPGEGYFEDDSLIRIVNRDLIVAFSGARALLLQAAHPVMFEGFYSRTSGLEDPHARLARTATVMDTIYFGRRVEADAQTARVRAIHPVPGSCPSGPDASAGTPYAADDPQFLLWTLAPLFESAERIYASTWAAWIDERDALWADLRVVGRLFGLPTTRCPPPSRTSAYYRGCSPAVTSRSPRPPTELGKQVVFHPPVPLHLRWLESMNAVVVGSLPAWLRRGYDLSWDPVREVLRRGGAEYTKRVLLPLLPGALRNTPVMGGRLIPGPPRPAADAA